VASSTLYVHALDVGDGPAGVARLRQGLQDQAAAAVRAVGTPEARAQLDTASGAPGDRRQERRP
jgi:division protein CdvB (Snf7/Vps24/ESCRT-III family)